MPDRDDHDPTLSDDLFGRQTRVEDTEPTRPITGDLTGDVTGDRTDDGSEDVDYSDGPRSRSKLTTALIIGLIFGLGTLFGVQLARALTPEPAPQVVYVLNDAGSPTPSASAPR